jgi:hypothetical protein
MPNLSLIGFAVKFEQNGQSYEGIYLTDYWLCQRRYCEQKKRRRLF